MICPPDPQGSCLVLPPGGFSPAAEGKGQQQATARQPRSSQLLVSVLRSPLLPHYSLRCGDEAVQAALILIQHLSSPCLTCGLQPDDHALRGWGV